MSVDSAKNLPADTDFVGAVEQETEKKPLGWKSPGRMLLLGLVVAGAAFGSTLPTWVTAQVHTSLSQASVEVAGSDAAPAVSSLALVVLAAVFTVRLVGPRARWLVCAVMGVSALGMTASIVQVLADPSAASVTEVGKATGMVGSAADYSMSAWPWLALGATFLILCFSVLTVFASRSWPSRRKFERGGAVPVAGEELDEIDTWDSLTEGRDPTR